MLTGQRTINLSQLFSRTRDTSLDGKRMRKGEFEAVPWFFAPSVNGYGSGSRVYISPHVITQNIDASLVPVLDTTVRDEKYIGQITVTVRTKKLGNNFRDVSYKYHIDVVEQTRPCAFDLPESQWDSAEYAEIK